MTFRTYLRCEGVVFVILGIGLYWLGLSEHEQSQADALSGGLMMVAGTAAFMSMYNGARFFHPGTWYTAKPMRHAEPGRSPCRRMRLLAALLVEPVFLAGLTLVCSRLTGGWLTYLDFAVWTLVMGVIKIGPSVGQIDRREARVPITFRVAALSRGGVVHLASDGWHER